MIEPGSGVLPEALGPFPGQLGAKADETLGAAAEGGEPIVVSAVKALRRIFRANERVLNEEAMGGSKVDDLFGRGGRIPTGSVLGWGAVRHRSLPGRYPPQRGVCGRWKKRCEDRLDHGGQQHGPRDIADVVLVTQKKGGGTVTRSVIPRRCWPGSGRLGTHRGEEFPTAGLVKKPPELLTMACHMRR